MVRHYISRQPESAMACSETTEREISGALRNLEYERTLFT